MKNIIICFAIILVIFIGLTVISDPSISLKLKVDEINTKNFEGMGFSIIKKLDYTKVDVYLVYDNVTKVEYLAEIGYGNISFCPYYDANGNVSIYGGGLND